MSVTSRVVLILEGGYDLSVIPDCASACTRALLGDKITWRTEVMPKREARIAIEQTMRSHRACWQCLTNDDSGKIMTASPVQIEAMQNGQSDAGVKSAGGAGGPDSNGDVPDDIQAALEQMEALQQKLQLFSQDFRTEEEDELRWQLEEVNFEIREMMNLKNGSIGPVEKPGGEKTPQPEAASYGKTISGPQEVV